MLSKSASIRSWQRLLIQTRSVGATRLDRAPRQHAAVFGNAIPMREFRRNDDTTRRTFHSSGVQRWATEDAPQHDSSSTGFARRSLLYVPGSSDKMIKKSQSSMADCITFDLEDSVALHRKGAARESVLHGLNAMPRRHGLELAVRINPPSGDRDLASDDLDVILPSHALDTIVVPKVESFQDVQFIIEKMAYHRQSSGQFRKLHLVLSIESANSLLQMPRIVDAINDLRRKRDLTSTVEIAALLFASEDYCAATGIIRTRERTELHFPRAHMAMIAKAYGLQAIDMVCIDYKDEAYLKEESDEGRRFGYDGKQAIHPAQVATIQEAFTPSTAAISRAARIKQAYEQGVTNNAGAVGFFDTQDNAQIMIDAPMLKQSNVILAKAKAAGIDVEQFTNKNDSGSTGEKQQGNVNSAKPAQSVPGG